MTAPSRTASARTATDEAVPVVGGREPCPCGSGKRYKQCHGRAARAAASAVVLRPFEGLAGEPDWVAIRDIVPAASGTAQLADGTAVRVASMLPGGDPAVRTGDGFQLGLQSVGGSGDLSRDAAAALVEAGAPVPPGTGDAPRLQDLLDASAPFVVTVHDDYASLLAPAVGEEALDEAATAALAEASESMVPTARLTGVEAAYWASVGARRHLRWVLPEDEQRLLDALARLHVAGDLGLGEGSRFLGAFRAQGLLVPVWDVAPDAEPGDVEAPAAALRAALDEALTRTGPLSDDERRARAGVASRQVTLR